MSRFGRSSFTLRSISSVPYLFSILVFTYHCCWPSFTSLSCAEFGITSMITAAQLGEGQQDIPQRDKRTNVTQHDIVLCISSRILVHIFIHTAAALITASPSKGIPEAYLSASAAMKVVFHCFTGIVMAATRRDTLTKGPHTQVTDYMASTGKTRTAYGCIFHDQL